MTHIFLAKLIKDINFANANGELAQLARAFGWQPKGHRFEPGILHKDQKKKINGN